MIRLFLAVFALAILANQWMTGYACAVRMPRGESVEALAR